MKKYLTVAAMALLLVGCNKPYDDSSILERVASLETRVTALESSIQSIQSAVGDGIFVQKVEEYADPATGKVVGITVTYTSGKVVYFEISPKADYSGPVLSVITSGSGKLVWAVDGIPIKVNGEEVTVYQTPVFSIDGEGNLLVSIDGADPVNLGKVTDDGATLVDGIFKDIKVEQDKVVLTLADDTVVNIPFAEAFKLVIENSEIVYLDKKVIEIPYTVTAKTEKTEVGVIGYSTTDFFVEVEEDKIVITPLKYGVSGVMMAYADSKIGLTSLVRLTVEPEGMVIADTPWSEEYDYVAGGEDAIVEVHVVSNVEFDVKPMDDWIHVKSVKGSYYTITLALDDNDTDEPREGSVLFNKKGTDLPVQLITIGQDKISAGGAPKDLSKNGTANSYIVTRAGQFKFLTVKGNTEESVGAVAKAEILWETWNNTETVTPNSVIASVSYENNYITFATPETLKPGNALIAAKDASDKILWSWHIWIPAKPITTIEEANYSATQKVMSRNLGALVDATIDAPSAVESFGLLYEWGRKDPFPGLGSVTEAVPASVAGVAMTKKEGPVSIEEAIANPTVYVYRAKADWLPDEMTSTSEIAKLWGEESKTVYDPCPVGYVLGKRNKSCAFWSGNKLNEMSADVFTLAADNYSFKVGSLVFPIAGYIDDGGEGHKKAGVRTILWSGRWDSGTANGYGFYGYTDDDGPKFRNQGNIRSRGGSVRCVVEPSAE